VVSGEGVLLSPLTFMVSFMTFGPAPFNSIAHLESQAILVDLRERMMVLEVEMKAQRALLQRLIDLLETPND